ncbi:hypothetical protein [Nocardia spumae]|uniref:hypothetical protein n=1 Tax=Nocardia spumae TaxID=2887190 RepID=UPI001D1589FC|nr:hypothetical protein [Nocardia spumae]
MSDKEIDDSVDGVAETGAGAEDVAPTEPDPAATSGGESEASSESPDAPKVSLIARWRPAFGGRGSTIALRAAAAVVLGAAVGTSIFFYLQDKGHRDVLAAQEQARQAACAYGPVVSTYDSEHLDRYVRDVLAGASGDWKKQFESNSKDLSDVLAKGEVVAKSTDVQCAIRSGDENSAEAIVVIGQTITSLGTQGKPEPGQLSTVMRLQKQGDRWLVDKISTPLAPLPPRS